MVIDYGLKIWRTNGPFIAHAMPLDVASAGGTEAAARAALDQAVRLFVKTAADHCTLTEVLKDAGYRFNGSRWASPERIGSETHSTAVTI
jgi:hypothetical protein